MVPWQGDVGGNTQAKDMGSVFKAGPASGAAFGGLRAFHKYGVGAGLTPASLKHKSDATTQNYWLRRLGLIRTHLGAELSQREESTKTAGADAAADHSATQQATASSAGKPMRRRSRRSSRIAIANCLSPKRGLSPRAGSAACSESDGGDVGVTAGNAVLASQVRRRHLMAQLTGEDIDARLMREVLMQAHRHVPRKQSSEHSDVGSFDRCRGSPSVGSSSSRRVDPLAGDGLSGVVSVSSRAHSSEAGAGADAASLESGGGDSCASSWSFLSALQVYAMQCTVKWDCGGLNGVSIVAQTKQSADICER